MHFHPVFHPWQRRPYHPMSPVTLQFLNLLVILLGIGLVFLLRPLAN